jgi:hypothetical protein
VKKKEWRMGGDVVVFCALLPVMGVGAHQGPPPLSVLLALGTTTLMLPLLSVAKKMDSATKRKKP